jgi:ADP-heptose:LPS heptosyltransferase
VKILINRTDAIGDTILTTPIAARLREKYPDADIRFLTSPICAPLFDDHPIINGAFVYNKKKSIFKRFSILSRIFKDFTPDIYIFAGGDQVVSFYAWLKRIKIRAGLVSKWQSFLFLNKGRRQKRSLVTMHESDYNLNLLQSIDLDYDAKNRSVYAPKIFIDETKASSDIAEFNQVLKDKGLDPSKENIFIHPGMTGHTLNWSSRNYARLIDKMENQFPGKFNWIISHTPSDNSYLVGLKEHLSKCEYLNNCVYFFDGSIKGLGHYMRILSSACAFVGPSTGTVHIANSLDVNVVGIYSPIKVQSSLRWGPFKRDDSKTRLVIPDVVCGEQFKCAGASCPYYECMSKIEVQDIINELSSLLKLEI